MKKKYELTNESISLEGHKLFRIKALLDFSTVKAGDLGGFIEEESNLSHTGDCWVFGDGALLDGAEVIDNAQLRGERCVVSKSKISGDVVLEDKVLVRKGSCISGKAYIHECCLIDASEVSDNVEVINGVCNGSKVSGNVVNNNSLFSGSEVSGKVIISELTNLENAKVSGEKVEIIKSIITGEKNLEIRGDDIKIEQSELHNNVIVYSGSIITRSNIKDDSVLHGTTVIDSTVSGGSELFDDIIKETNIDFRI